MACTRNLYNDLNNNTLPTNGTWTQQSGPTLPPTGTGNNATVNFTGAATGTYVYRYTFTPVGGNPCPSYVDLTYNVVAPPNAGNTFAVSVCCTPNTPVNLFSLLGNSATSGGTWTVSPSIPNCGVGGLSGNNFTPDCCQIGVGQTSVTFTFTYTVTAANAAAGCTNCTATQTGTVTVYKAPNPGSPVTLTVCN